MKSSSQSNTNQQQVVSQSTTVNVQNVIEQPKPSQIEQFKMFADVVNALDGPAQTAPGAVVITTQQKSAFDFLTDPNTMILVGSVLFGALLLIKKV